MFKYNTIQYIRSVQSLCQNLCLMRCLQRLIQVTAFAKNNQTSALGIGPLLLAVFVRFGMTPTYSMAVRAYSLQGTLRVEMWYAY